MTQAPARRTMTEAAGLGHSGPQQLVGIARMAAASPQVRERAEVDAPELLREELRQAKDKGLPVALGTATDPYQPAEKQFEITRRMLEVLAGFEGLDFSITTKSVLILR